MSELEKPSEAFQEFLDESIESKFVSNLDESWQSTKQIRIHFFYGDISCIPLDEYIYTPSGIVQIKNVYEGMSILGGFVKGIKEFEDDVYELDIKGTKFRATGEHPLWMRKYKEQWGYYKQERRYRTKTHPEWITIKDVYDHYTTKKSTTSRWFVQRYESKSFKFDEISIGVSFAKLLGYLMSDGYFSETQSVKFTNINKKFLAEVVNLALSIPDLDLEIKSYEKENGQDIMLTRKHGYNVSLLKNRLRELGVIDRTTFGKLTSLTESELIAFIQGFFNGDGHLSTHGKNPFCNFYVGIHEKQAYELQFMLWRLGIIGYVRWEQEKPYNKKQWYVEVGQRKYLKILLSLLDDSKYPHVFEKARKRIDEMNLHNDHQVDKDGEWIPIFSIKKIGKMKVRGWQTLPTHEIISYNGLRTHNSGKSSAMEQTAELYKKKGMTVFHGWSARDFENLFWCINKNCKRKFETMMKKCSEQEQNILKHRLHCECDKYYSVLWIIPEYLEIDKFTLDKFNGVYWTNIDEYRIAVLDGKANRFITEKDIKLLLEGKLKKTQELIPKPRLVVEQVPIPKGVQNQDIFDQRFAEIMLRGRDENYVIVNSPESYESEEDKFIATSRMIEILPHIRNEYFTGNKMKDKLVCVFNELRTLAPPSNYSFQKGARHSKRPIVDQIPELRHIGYYFLGDVQNPDDINGTVRPHAHTNIIKRATQLLLGKEWQWFFEVIESKRATFLARFDVEDERYAPPELLREVDRFYPKIEEIPKNRGYVVHRNGEFFLETFDSPTFHHKQEGENFFSITGIKWKFNKKRVEKTALKSQENTIKSDRLLAKQTKDMHIRMIIKMVKDRENPKNYGEALEILRDKVKAGELPDSSVLKLSRFSLSNKINRNAIYKKMLSE